MPREHQTDRMSTAVNNTSERREFTSRYEALLRHYRLKRAAEQALLLRGSREFLNLEAYKGFLRLLLAQLNAGRRERLAIEMQYLRTLPAARLESMKRIRAKVDSGSLIYVDRNVYSVHSRPIGEHVEARVGAE